MLCISSVQFSHSVLSDPLWPHGLQHARPPCPSPTPGVYSDSCPLSRWCHPTTSSSVVPFSSSLHLLISKPVVYLAPLLFPGAQNYLLSPGGTSGKEPACQCRRRGFHPWVRKILWRRKWQPILVFLPGESHGQRSLVAIVHGVSKSQTRLSNFSRPHFMSKTDRQAYAHGLDVECERGVRNAIRFYFLYFSPELVEGKLGCWRWERWISEAVGT